MDRVDSSGLATCQQGMQQNNCQAALAAQAKALKDLKIVKTGLKQLQSERAAIAGGTQKGLSSSSASLERSLRKHFGSSSDSLIGKLQGQISEVQSALEDRSGYYQFQEASIGRNFEKTVPYSSNVTLTPSFSAIGARNQEVTILHGFRHSFGANFPMFEYYEEKALINPSPWWSTRNADSFALFIYNSTH